jgi:titin
MSEYCAKSDRFVPYTLPGAPTITNVVAGNGVAFLYFTDGSSNGRPITKYQYQYTINGVTSSFEVTGTSPLQITGLTNGTNYTVTLKNYNLAGYSPASIASSGFMPYTVPSAPTITNLIPASNQITVYVSPGNTNGSVITRYSYSLNGGSYVNTADAALSFDISGLTNGTSYTVALKAENAAGVGAASTTSAAVIPFTVPNAPTITGVTVGNTTATVAITNGNNNGRTATQYQYTYTNTSTGVATILTTSTSATQLSSILITGLTNWASYTVKVKAINQAGASVDSSASNPFMPYNIPGAPVIASIVPGNASILVNMDGLTIGTGVVGYRYSFNSTNYTYISGGGSSFSIPNLVNATTYRVYVKSVTSQGDSPASLQSNPVIPYTVPNAPTISSVVAGNRTVSIYVVDGSNNGRSVINYEYSTDGSKYNIVDPVSPIVLNNLVNWQSYSFYVRAVNLAGSSGSSAMSSTVVPFLVPTSASIASIIPGDGQLTVKMDGWTSDAGIIGYKYALDTSENLMFVSSTTDSFTIPELTNGRDYVVRVKSCTTAGDSPYSSISSPIHPSAPPSPPSNVVVTPLNESAIVTFIDGSANGEAIQYYLYSLSGDVVDTPIKKRDDGTLKLFGIPNAINYTLRLRAKNETGLSDYSVASNAFMPFGVPLVAPVVTQVLPGNACAYVYFSAADTNGSELTKFRWTDGKTTYDVSGITSPLTITGIANKKAVTISIASCNAVGISPFTTAISVIPGIPSPPVITSVVAGPTMLLVYFDVPLDNGFAISSYSYGFVGSPAFSKGTSASTTSVSPLMINKLKNGTPYNVVLTAINANGSSVISNSVGNRIPCAPPAKIAITVVNSLIDGALVSFVAPLDNGTPIIKYKYAFGTSTNYTDASGLTLPLRIYGTSPNTVNTVKIIATNAAGDSLESAPSKAFTFVYLPPAVVKITGLTITLNRLTVAFLPPVLNGSAIIGYKYALNDSTTFIDASGTTLPLVITDGILPNVTYNVRIIAVNGAGESAASAPAAKPVSFVYLPPIAPTITTVVVGDRSALVTFTGAPSRGAPITGYAYTLDSSATTIYDVSGAVSPLLITELTNDMSYNIRIAAMTPVGYSAWSVAKPATPVYKKPDKPVITTVTATATGQLTVVFTAPAANGSPITGYKYTTDGGANKTEIATIILGKSFVIDGLTNGTPYNVQICATNILGESDLSLVKAGTPKA